MYQFSYADIQTDSVADARDRERQVLDRSITLMKEAELAGVDSPEAAEAILFTNRVWTTLLEDLAGSDNVLPSELKASLISIGLWALRQTEALRQGEAKSFSALIEISEIIRDGIQ
jgi:flagellar protein FlaF